jgi:hypothetical protein
VARRRARAVLDAGAQVTRGRTEWIAQARARVSAGRGGMGELAQRRSIDYPSQFFLKIQRGLVSSGKGLRSIRVLLQEHWRAMVPLL